MEIYTALDFNFQKLNKCRSNQLRTFFLIKIQNKVTAASGTTSKFCSSIMLLILSTNRAGRKITELDKDTGHVARKTDVHWINQSHPC